MNPAVPSPSEPLTSRVVTLEQLYAGSSFGPAAVQRDYQWRAPQCRTLLADLDRAFSASSFSLAADADDDASDSGEAEPEALRVEGDFRSEGAPRNPVHLDYYMLGAIVVTPPVDDFCLVYDGLQRLTTLTVLFAVLRDMTSDAALADHLDGMIRLDAKRYRLTLAGKDATLSRQVQPRGEAIKIRRGEAQSDMGGRIRTAAGIFREGIKSWDDARRDQFARFVLSQVRIVLIEASDPRLARQIFVTTNMRGKNLNRVDLLKGQLVDIATDEDTARQVVAHWNGARNASGDEFEALLVAVDFIERRSSQGDDCLNELAEYLAEKRGPRGIESWLQRLTHYAGDWRELQAVLATPPADAFASDIWRLQLFKWHNWRPLALLWYSDYRRAQRQGGPGAAQKMAAAQRRFAALHRRCMAITLAGFSHVDREKIFGRAISQVNRDINPLSSAGALAFNPQQTARIRETLRVPMMDKDIRVMLVRWLESMAHADTVPVLVRETTVEHVLPRRPGENTQWTVDFPDPEARFLSCHALGNLAGIDKQRNEVLKNAEFALKQPIYAAAATEYATLVDIAAANRWTEAEIESRTERLATDIERYLDLPPPFTRPPA